MLLSCLFIADLDHEYQLNVPFIRTGPGEIGNWTLRGQAVAQKRAIHLTTTVPSVFGGLCSRLPTNANDWTSEIDFSMKQDTFYLTLSKNLCPDVFSKFNGMNITLTPQTNGSLSTRIEGVEVLPSTTSIVDNFNYSNRHSLKITKEHHRILVFLDGSQMFNISVFNNYDQTYFSIFAQSPPVCIQCLTDIHGFTYIPSSERRNLDPSLDNRNRKALRSTANKRSMMKMLRRATMQIVTEYLEEGMANDDYLTGTDTKLKDSLAEVKEMLTRANHTISADDLKDLIDTKVRPVLDKAAQRFENVANAMFSTKADMKDIWVEAGNQLRAIRSDVTNQCIDIENEARKYIFQIFKLVPEEFHEEPPQSGRDFSFWLLAICAVEFVAYIIFFIRYHFTILNKKRA